MPKMTQGEGYELFTCPHCGSALYHPDSGCVECEVSPDNREDEGAESRPPTYTGGDAVLKARLEDAELELLRQREAWNRRSFAVLPTPYDIILAALGGSAKRKRRKPARPRRNQGTQAAKAQKSPEHLEPSNKHKPNRENSTWVSGRLKPVPVKPAATPSRPKSPPVNRAPSSAAITVFGLLPSVRRQNFQSWLQIVSHRFEVVERVLDVADQESHVGTQENGLSLLFYQLFTELKQPDNARKRERALELVEAILAKTGPLT